MKSVIKTARLSINQEIIYETYYYPHKKKKLQMAAFINQACIKYGPRQNQCSQTYAHTTSTRVRHNELELKWGAMIATLLFHSIFHPWRALSSPMSTTRAKFLRHAGQPEFHSNRTRIIRLQRFRPVFKNSVKILDF